MYSFIILLLCLDFKDHLMMHIHIVEPEQRDMYMGGSLTYVAFIVK